MDGGKTSLAGGEMGEEGRCEGGQGEEEQEEDGEEKEEEEQGPQPV